MYFKEKRMNNNRLKQLHDFLDKSPNEPFILFALAKEYEKLKDFDNAIKYYEISIQADENYVGTYYHLGKINEVLNNFQKAISIYENGIKIAKKIGDTHSLSELIAAKMEIED